MTALPINCIWDGEAFVPAGTYWAKKADEEFVVGQRYRIGEYHDRSPASHNHQFAWLNEAWQSLPDELYDQYPSPEHLRKFALIAKGHCTMVQHACASNAEALRLAAAIRPYDTYAVVSVRGPVVTVYNAVSQSVKAMDGPQFQKSKQDVIDFVADLLGVAPDDLRKAA